MRFLLALILIAPMAGPPAQASDTVLAAIRAGQWTQADTLAAANADPLAAKLATYYRLLTPGAARANEVAAFIAANPDWPSQALLNRRLQEAVALERDDRAVLDICRLLSPPAPPALLRCADAASRAGAPDATDAARQAWIAGITDPAAEAAFLAQWGGQITPDDQWRRFDRLAWTETATGGAAARQSARLPAAMRAAAEARLALKRDDPAAPALISALPRAGLLDPGLIYELARWRRRIGQNAEAAQVWTGPGVAAEAAALPERRAAFWDERNLLARRLLSAGDAAQAYAVAAGPAASTDAAIDASFLAGWIALRRLNQPGVALRHFTTLAGLSQAAITQARARYWMGRANDAARQADAAQADYAAAAQWPTTYYGQLAAMSLGEAEAGVAARVKATQDPGWTADQAQAFLSQETARAAVLLAAWGEPRRARPFIQRLDERAATGADRALAAKLALGLGLPDQAVAVARRAGRDGVMLPGAGWPAAAEPPEGPVEQAVVLGLIRQESSFDVAAMSPSGARGLMQLMPATAAGVARRLGLVHNLAALTADATYNMRLGTTYLQGLLMQFDQALPLAIAGYNAGPHRVTDWLAGPIDPAAGPADMIDWIEMIPFNETRNYVQRVIENIVVYRAQTGTTAPHPILRAAAP